MKRFLIEMSDFDNCNEAIIASLYGVNFGGLGVPYGRVHFRR